MRLFFAIDFPPSAKEELGQLVRRLADQAVCGNFTRKENFHLTLVFLGELPQARLAAALEALEKLQAPGFTLNLSGLGSFPRGGRDIYWLGVEENPGLMALQRQLSASLEEAGFALEKRPFKPHLTLGREVLMPPAFDGAAFARGIARLEIPVERVTLMESLRIAGKLVYRPAASKNLTPTEEA